MMLFHESKDESAIGLALVGLVLVVMAAVLGNVTGDVQPKAPVEMTHPDTSSPYLHGKASPESNPSEASPYRTPSK